MALPSTGPISFSQVNVEIQRAATNPLGLNDATVRALAGKASGAISMADLRGKAWWIYDTTNRYGGYYGGGYPVGLTIYTGVDITIKNPTIRMWGSCRNGAGEVSDNRIMECYGKRTDGTWDLLGSQRHDNDIENGTDTFDWSFNVTNGLLYNQFMYNLQGMGGNWYQMDCYVDACYHQ